MAELRDRLDMRISPEQHQRLEWLAGYVGLSSAAIVRTLLDGVTVLDGVDLVATLTRLRFAEPGTWTADLHVVVGKSATARQAHEQLQERRAEA